MHSARRNFGDELHATIVRILGYVGVIAGLVILGARLFGQLDADAAIEPARTDWVNVERPYRAFTLTLPEFAEPDYAIRRNVVGGGRKDILTWGGPDSAGSRLMVEIYRPGKELKRFGDPASEIAVRASELGTVTNVKAAAPIDSKFGPVALAGFTATAGERSRACLGFARAFHDPRLEITGWYCKANDEIIESPTLSCALERLSLLAAASEPEVQELFERAELKRTSCGIKPIGRAGNLQRHDWIAAPKAPKLRGRIAAR